MPDGDATQSNPKGNPEFFLIMFAPQEWTPARRFSFFLGPPFSISRGLVQATRAAENRRQKHGILAGLANQLRLGLAEDYQELDDVGFTSAARSKRFSAVVETMFLELYSSLDAVRSALFEAYRRVRGVQNKSTNRLFQRAHEDGYGPEFPEPVRQALSAAYSSWYQELRRIRVELSHGNIGSCHIDLASGKVIYMHDGLGTDQRALVIDDLEAKVNELSNCVFALVDEVFLCLCSQLEPVEVVVPCGVFRERLYERTVSYDDNLDLHSGVCFSKRWFENEPDHLCPVRTRCGAYLTSTGG